jgi:hypothetical protein
MSSVGSSDSSSGNRADETARRRAEEQRAQEADTARKHKKELRRLAETHYKEIEDLKKSHAEQMEELKAASNDSITSRDFKHQKEVEDMREMYRKQQKAAADENLRREESLRQAGEGDGMRSKANAEAKVNKLGEDYKRELLRKEQQFGQTLQDAREAQSRAINENRSKLSKSHDVETKAILDERNEKVAQLEQDMTNYRENSEMMRRDRELQHMRDINRASDNLMRSVANERASRKDSEEILRDGFKHGIETMRDRFEDAQKAERNAQNMASANFKTGAMDRIDTQVRRLEGEKEDLKAATTRKELQLKAQKDQEIDNIREAWSKNIDNYRDQRDLAVAQSNERNQKDVGEVRDKYEKTLMDTNRFYRNRMNEEGRIQRLAYDNLVGDFESKTEHMKNVSDQRVKTIFENAADEKSRLSELQKNTHIASQRLHQDQLRELREEMDNDKQQTVNRLQNQMRKQEVQHSERMNQVVQKYEKTIQGLKDQMMQERKLADENLKRTVDELQRSHKLSLDQVESKNRERMRQLSSQQAEEIRQVNKRHEDRLDQVIVEVKKS